MRYLGSVPRLTDSDVLLSVTPRTRERPHYSEATFSWKERAARRYDVRYRPSPARQRSEIAYLTARLLAAAVSRARLSPVQREVFAARTGGDSYVEIGHNRGWTTQGAFMIFQQALDKIRRAMRADPYYGLPEVYRGEVSRR